MNFNLEKNLNLKNLDSFFPEINPEVNSDDDEKRKAFKKLQDKFNLYVFLRNRL